ncbi:MAG: CRTAC1 family protein [Rhodobacteraceae bacterium]|nr:CRTAC1 family protein [Paracoccaceae bacterium]
MTLSFAAPSNAGEISFEDRSHSLPAEHVYTGGWEHFVGGGVALLDCDDDGGIDIFAAGGANPARLFINASDPAGAIRFRQGEMHPLTSVTGAYPMDLDGDGFLDLMVLRNGPNVFLKGAGDCRFTDATEDLGIVAGDAWSTAFSATWEDGAHLPTLAIGNYVDAKNPDGPFGTCDTNWLVRPDGDTYSAPVALERGYCPLSMLFSDWQRSGRAMLRISNDRQYYVRDGYEQMWSLDPLRELGAEDGWPRMMLWGMGIASHDITGDGLPEVMLTSMGDQMLMANEGDRFSTVPYETGTFAQRPFTGDDGRPSTGWHAEFGDVDNDSRQDLFIAKGNVDQMPGMAMKDPNNLLVQQHDGRFLEMADTAGVASTARSRGAGLADLNNDGLLDIVVLNRRAPLEVWQNTTRAAGNWVAISARQTGANTRAIGGVIELRTEDGIQTRELTVGGGHVSGRAGPAHFGIGGQNAAEVRVIWPDKTETPWTRVQANEVARIVKAPAGQ